MSQSWIFWSLLSAFFAGATAVLAKVGVAGVDSNLATAIRTTVILLFAWTIALMTARPAAITGLSGRTWLFPALARFPPRPALLLFFPPPAPGSALEGGEKRRPRTGRW